MNDTVNMLKDIFEKHKRDKICVIGTTCCGKTTLQKQFSEAVDMDEVLWPTLSKEEEKFICSKPWTSEIGDFTYKLVSERVVVQAGHPLFTLILLDCDVIVYLDINDDVLKEHCEKRNASFDDAKNVKNAIEKSLDMKKESNIVRYDVQITE